MLSELFDSPARIRAVLGGPAGVHIEAFAERLFQRGYSKIFTRRHIQSAEHIVRWGVRRGLSPLDLGGQALKTFDRFADAPLVLYAPNQAIISTQFGPPNSWGPHNN